MDRIELDDGKYTVINELGKGGGLKALRYGEEWRNLAGDNLILAMFHKIEELQEELIKTRKCILEGPKYRGVDLKRLELAWIINKEYEEKGINILSIGEAYHQGLEDAKKIIKQTFENSMKDHLPGENDL